MFTKGLATLSSMTAVTLDGTSRGGGLPTILSDDSHGLVDANEVIVTLEESGEYWMLKGGKTKKKASDGIFATRSPVYVGLRRKKNQDA